MFRLTAGFFHISSFMTGKKATGKSEARMTAERRFGAEPVAAVASMCAVAGRTARMSCSATRRAWLSAAQPAGESPLTTRSATSSTVCGGRKVVAVCVMSTV